MIKINELRVGNIVSVNNGFEMLVHSIFRNDTVYLDFIPPLINEADVWEEDCKDVCPVELTEEWLLKYGFKKHKDIIGSYIKTPLCTSKGYGFRFHTQYPFSKDNFLGATETYYMEQSIYVKKWIKIHSPATKSIFRTNWRRIKT